MPEDPQKLELHLSLQPHARHHYRPVDLAREARISVASVRFYEREGFIPIADRRPSGHRIYREIHRDALITSRLAIEGYGWQSARQMMRTVHEGATERIFELIDEHHATRDRIRRDTKLTVELLTTITPPLDSQPHTPPFQQPMTVGDASAWLGFSVASLRFWESEGLIRPQRHQSSNYRMYSDADIVRLRVIGTLRTANYGIPQIRVIVRELDLDHVDAALTAANQHIARLADQSRACSHATSAVVTYLAKWSSEDADLAD